jgi:anti-anti-sigma factor
VTADLYELTSERRDDVTIVRVTGEVDASNAAHVQEQILQLARTRAVIVVLTEVGYLDSAGIAMLEALRREKDLHLVLAEGSVVLRALRIVGFDQLVPVSASTTNALEALRGH